MAKGTVPTADVLDILDSFPVPQSRHEQWYSSKRERLIQETIPWYCHQQAGGAGPLPLQGEALLDHYCSLLDTEVELVQQHGKLLAYRALHHGGDSLWEIPVALFGLCLIARATH